MSALGGRGRVDVSECKASLLCVESSRAARLHSHTVVSAPQLHRKERLTDSCITDRQTAVFFVVFCIAHFPFLMVLDLFICLFICLKTASHYAVVLIGFSWGLCVLMRLACSLVFVMSLESLPILIRISVLLCQSLTSGSFWVLSSLCEGPFSTCIHIGSLVPQCRNVRETLIYTACYLIIILIYWNTGNCKQFAWHSSRAFLF